MEYNFGNNSQRIYQWNDYGNCRCNPQCFKSEYHRWYQLTDVIEKMPEVMYQQLFLFFLKKLPKPISNVLLGEILKQLLQKLPEEYLKWSSGLIFGKPVDKVIPRKIHVETFGKLPCICWKFSWRNCIYFWRQFVKVLRDETLDELVQFRNNFLMKSGSSSCRNYQNYFQNNKLQNYKLQILTKLECDDSRSQCFLHSLH